MLRKIAPAVAVLFLTGTASASNITSQTTFIASGTSSSGDQINAEAVFSFNNISNTLTVTLTNLLPNPGSVAQNITDFSFSLLGSNGTPLTMVCSVTCVSGASASGSATMGTVTVASGGAPTYSTTAVNPGWAVGVTGATFLMNGLGGSNTPAYSIIGPPGAGGTYSNAGGSIAGNGPHNPFVYTTATWTFALSTLPATFSIGDVVFSFNTTAGDTYSCASSGCTSMITPEPWTFVLAGTGLIGIFFIRRRTGSRRTGSRS